MRLHKQSRAQLISFLSCMQRAAPCDHNTPSMRSTFTSTRDLQMYEPMLARESTAMMTPCLKMNPRVVVPCLGFTSSIASLPKLFTCNSDTAHLNSLSESGVASSRRRWRHLSNNAHRGLRLGLEAVESSGQKSSGPHLPPHLPSF